MPQWKTRWESLDFYVFPTCITLVADMIPHWINMEETKKRKWGGKEGEREKGGKERLREEGGSKERRKGLDYETQWAHFIITNEL